MDLGDEKEGGSDDERSNDASRARDASSTSSGASTTSRSNAASGARGGVSDTSATQYGIRLGQKAPGSVISDVHQPPGAEPPPAETRAETEANADKRVRALLASTQIRGRIAGSVRVLNDEEFANKYAEIAVATYKESDPDWTAEGASAVAEGAKAGLAKMHALTAHGQILVKKGYDELGTLVHEGIHLYGRDRFSELACNGESQGINEGMTEYFARRALGGAVQRSAYGSEVETVESIVKGLASYFSPSVAPGAPLAVRRSAKQYGDEMAYTIVRNAYFGGPAEIARFKQAYADAFGNSWDADFTYINACAKGGNPVVNANERNAAVDGGLGDLFGGGD